MRSGADMTLPEFPQTLGAPEYPLKEAFYKPQVRTEFENGSVQSRPRFTRGRHQFTLTWDAMPAADYATLEQFFNEFQSCLFWWAHPLTGKRYQCRFSGDKLEGELTELDFYKVSLAIEEA